jgi:hypothetical protein
MKSNGNPQPRYSALGAESQEKPDSKELVDLEPFLVNRIQSKLGNTLRNMEKATAGSLCKFFTNPMWNPYSAKVLKVKLGTTLWPIAFARIDGGYYHFGPNYQEFWNNFHVWNGEHDKKLQLGVNPSNGVISFFEDPPEKTLHLTVKKVTLGPLFMILFELVLSNWSRVGPRMLVPEEDLIQGPDHASQCAEILLNSTYPSMNPTEEEMSAEAFYVPKSKATDPHFVINPSIFAFVFMLLKGFGHGKTVSNFLRDDYVKISRNQRLNQAELSKLKETEENIEEFFRENWKSVRESFKTHFVGRAKVAMQQAPGNRMLGAGFDDDDDDNSNAGNSSNGSRAPENEECSYMKMCVHGEDENPPVMFICSDCHTEKNKVHKLCAQAQAEKLKCQLPKGCMDSLEAMSFKVCLSCLEGKCVGEGGGRKEKGTPAPSDGAHRTTFFLLKKLGTLLRNIPTGKIFVFLKLYSHTYNK